MTLPISQAEVNEVSDHLFWVVRYVERGDYDNARIRAAFLKTSVSKLNKKVYGLKNGVK